MREAYETSLSGKLLRESVSTRAARSNEHLIDSYIGFLMER